MRLVLARLHDTSLASWEGLARRQQAVREQSTKKSMERSMKAIRVSQQLAVKMKPFKIL